MLLAYILYGRVGGGSMASSLLVAPACSKRSSKASKFDGRN